MAPLANRTIATVGSGVMAEAMIAGLLRGELVESGPGRRQSPALRAPRPPRARVRHQGRLRQRRRDRRRRRRALRHQAPDARPGRARDRTAPPPRAARPVGHRRCHDRGADRDARSRPGHPGDAEHAGQAGQGHDRLVSHAGDDAGAARTGGDPARCARQGARGRRREVRRDGDRRSAAPARRTSSS